MCEHIGTNIIEDDPWKGVGIALLTLGFAISIGVVMPSWMLNRTGITVVHKYIVAVVSLIAGIWTVSLFWPKHLFPILNDDTNARLAYSTIVAIFSIICSEDHQVQIIGVNWYIIAILYRRPAVCRISQVGDGMGANHFEHC